MAATTSFPKEKIKILLLEGVHTVSVETFNKAGYTNVERLTKALPEDELIAKLEDDVQLVGIRSKTQLTEKVLKAAKKLRAVGCFCIGTNQVDLKTARQLGIAVFNSPYSNTRSVAEMVVAEVVMLMRRIPHRSARAHQGIWLKSAVGSNEVRGKTIGIVGYGHIGSQVSILAEAMGLKVLYYDIVPKLPLGNANSVDTLDELLERSDVVTLHVPETPETKNMITKTELSKMQEGSYLINLSRGTVVVIEDLKAAIESNHLAGAAVDVFPKEPRSKGEVFTSELQGLDNVILTPHIGGSTQEAQYNIGIDAATKLINYMDRGSTVGSHTIPELHLSGNRDAYRILHIHRNEPGVMAAINNTIGKFNVNILGQYLRTSEDVGYVVTDLAPAPERMDEIMKVIQEEVPAIKMRALY